MVRPIDGSSVGQNTYVIDAESATEMARLMNQNRLVTENMGGLFSEGAYDLARINTVLDIACGPGAWVLEVAHKYPKVQVVGMDISSAVIEYARAQAWAQGLDNVKFEVMDALHPLEFVDNSWGLVNLRFGTGVIPSSSWLSLLKECWRVTCVGGIMRLTEVELSITNNLAFERMSGLLARALQLAGYTFSPDGRSLGNIPVLLRLMRLAGWRDIGKQAHIIDFSAGTGVHRDCYQNSMVAFKLLQPFLIKCGVTTQEEIDALYQQAMTEMLLDSFCGVCFYLTMWGVKACN
ncbi:MAG: class I SAM-dependent methyltransferase [Chloroflexota bacterium]|nr:class I SAM-dependent methyltransferase [Chloroflexota bacterium]